MMWNLGYRTYLSFDLENRQLECTTFQYKGTHKNVYPIKCIPSGKLKGKLVKPLLQNIGRKLSL